MKKVLTIMVILMLSMVLCNVAYCAEEESLADKLYSIGSEYGFTTQDKVKIERYLATNEITRNQEEQIISKAQEMVEVMSKEQTKDYDSLSKESQSKIKKIASEAANILGLTLEYSSRSVSIYKDGILQDVYNYDNEKLLYTGNDSNINIVLVSGISIISAIALITIVKRKTLYGE